MPVYVWVGCGKINRRWELQDVPVVQHWEAETGRVLELSGQLVNFRFSSRLASIKPE